jgi:hypothetical protein
VPERKLGDWLDAWMQYCDSSESPELFKKWTGVSVLAGALQRRCWCVWEGKIYPNMYIIIIGPSGTRKGTAIRPGLELINSAPTIKLAADSTTREALINELEEVLVSEEIEPGKAYMHSSLTIFSPELTVFFGYKNDQLLTELTDWYDSPDNWDYKTKNCGENAIVGMCVNLLGATTPEVLQHSLPPMTIGGGLTSRIMFIYGDKKSKLNPFPFKLPQELELFEDLKHDLNCITQLRGQFSYTEDFLKSYEPWYRHFEDNPPLLDYRFGPYLERRAMHLLKLCMVMSASRGDDLIIDSSIFQRAVQWLEECEKKMERIYRGYGRKDYAPVMAQILRYVARHGVEVGCSFTDVLSHFITDVDTQELRNIVDSFVRSGMLETYRDEERNELMMRYKNTRDI